MIIVSDTTTLRAPKNTQSPNQQACLQYFIDYVSVKNLNNKYILNYHRTYEIII